ncbi:MAG: NADP-dependent malic enzyme [Endomicrobium sp.]|jgi:malate dehydrogenase (oxaloacetate-decarboxylating)|nr:NADP-dependent malic enzyme [Endomicrobium sp.]
MKKNMKDVNKPLEISRKLHPFYKGKIEIIPKCRIKDFTDFAIWYSPGVASVCMDIYKNPELVYEYTNKWNSIAIVSDGSRVLGLGNIGAEASLPVMEGKALLYKYLGGVDAYPICLEIKSEDEIIQTTKTLQPSFGGINLEDIEQPKCFTVLNRLKKECSIPVWHDDQQGTAIVTLAGLINALKIVNKKINEVKIAMIGAGSANICISKLLAIYGADLAKMIVVDSKGIISKCDTRMQTQHYEKKRLANLTNINNLQGGIKEAMKNADVLIALSTPGPNIIKKEWIRYMSKDPIIFACANPIPEIWPWLAKEEGAAVVATGRSDFDNQVNNSLGFPGVFRGVLDVRAHSITDSMCIEAALALASCIPDNKINPKKILPNMDDLIVVPRLAASIGVKAIREKVADKKLSYDELFNNAKLIIERSRAITETMMKKGHIKKSAKNPN